MRAHLRRALFRCLFLLLPLSACAGLGGHDAAGGPNCPGIENAYQTWGAIAALSTALAGSGAIASIPVDDKDTRIVMSLSSAALAGLGASSIYLRDALTKQYGAECEIMSPLAETSSVASLTPHRR